MNKLNLKNINLQAPYTVHEREDKQHEFYFWSDFGIVYDINFTPNDSIIPSGAIEVGINNREKKVSPRDPKFLKTLTVIIEEFFACNLVFCSLIRTFALRKNIESLAFVSPFFTPITSLAV